MNVRRWFRFSLATLLFVTFCLSGFFAGYHYGRLEGVEAGLHIWEGESIQVHTYYVGDVLPDINTKEYSVELAVLLNKFNLALASTVEPLEAGKAWIAPHKPKVSSQLADHESITVVDTIKHHKKIDSFLNGLREKKQLAKSRGQNFRIADQPDESDLE